MENNTDQGYLLLGYQYIRKQRDTLAQHARGARTCAQGEDIHQIRVASWRPSAAPSMSGECLPAKPSRRCRSQIHKFARDLGPTGDLDVQTLSLDHLRSGVCPDTIRKWPRRLRGRPW